MNAIDAAHRIGQRFDEDGLRYAIGGALALGVWGAPRATQDVDVTVFVPEAELPRVLDALERAGVLFDRDDAARQVARLGLCQGRLGRIIVDVFLSEHPQYAAMEGRVRRVSDGSGRELCFISPEDLCLHKIFFGRLKDVADLENLLSVRPQLDLEYVRSWLVQMIPPGDRRFDILADLERRFVRRDPRAP